MKKFRFQLLAEWINGTFPPCTVGDVGGGKGLLAFLLDRSGFEATVIDPHPQALPEKFRDLTADRRVRLGPEQSVRRVAAPFTRARGERFDLLVGLHSHGTNLAILDTVQAAGSSCVVVPCCVIDEPATPPIGKNWFSWLLEQAQERGLEPRCFYLNFRGQHLGFYVRGRRPIAPGAHDV